MEKPLTETQAIAKAINKYVNECKLKGRNHRKLKKIIAEPASKFRKNSGWYVYFVFEEEDPLGHTTANYDVDINGDGEARGVLNM